MRSTKTTTKHARNKKERVFKPSLVCLLWRRWYSFRSWFRSDPRFRRNLRHRCGVPRADPDFTLECLISRNREFLFLHKRTRQIVVLIALVNIAFSGCDGNIGFARFHELSVCLFGSDGNDDFNRLTRCAVGGNQRTRELNFVVLRRCRGCCRRSRQNRC